MRSGESVKDFLFDRPAIYAVRDRMKSHAVARRERCEPLMCENSEAVADAQVRWAEAQRKAA